MLLTLRRSLLDTIGLFNYNCYYNSYIIIVSPLCGIVMIIAAQTAALSGPSIGTKGFRKGSILSKVIAIWTTKVKQGDPITSICFISVLSYTVNGKQNVKKYEELKRFTGSHLLQAICSFSVVSVPLYSSLQRPVSVVIIVIELCK